MKLGWNCGAKAGQMLSLLNLHRVATQSEVSEQSIVDRRQFQGIANHPVEQ